MGSFFLLMAILVFIVMLIGLFKPNFALKWLGDKDKTRLKVIYYYGIAIIVLFTIFILLEMEAKVFSLFLSLGLISIFSLIIGILSPKLVLPWIKKDRKTRKSVSKYYGLALLVCFIVMGLTVPPIDAEKMEEIKIEREKVKQEKQAKLEEKERAKEEVKTKIKKEILDGKETKPLEKEKAKEEIKTEKVEKSKEESKTVEKDLVDLEIYVDPKMTIKAEEIELDINTNLIDGSLVQVTILGQNLESLTGLIEVENGWGGLVFTDITSLGQGPVDLEIYFGFEDDTIKQKETVEKTYGKYGEKLKKTVNVKNTPGDKGNSLYSWYTKFAYIS